MTYDKTDLRQIWRRAAATADRPSPVPSLEAWLHGRGFEALLATLPLPGEPDLVPLLERWLSVGRVGLPRTGGPGRMEFALVDSLTGPWHLKPSGLREPPPSGVWEPGPRTLVLIPGLAFAKTPDGIIRLGRGGGYFDRWLAIHRQEVTTLGVGFPFQLTDTLPREPHDILLDGYLDSQGFHGRAL